MKLNSTESIHGIMQGFTTLTDHAEGSCRTTVYNGTLYCAYRTKEQKIFYITKPQYADWGSPVMLERGIVSHNTPSFVSFNEKLWLIYTDENYSTVLSAWSESHATFLFVRRRPIAVAESATFAQLNNKLYMFYRVYDCNNIFCSNTSDMEHWSASTLIKKDGLHAITSDISPVAITYQGLIHLIYKERQGEFNLLKSDGEHWTSAIPLISADYGHSPGIAVHNGLLKLVFTELSNVSTPALYQYGYDGNALSPVVASTLLGASQSPALSTQDGKLIAVYIDSAPAAMPVIPLDETHSPGPSYSTDC